MPEEERIGNPNDYPHGREGFSVSSEDEDWDEPVIHVWRPKKRPFWRHLIVMIVVLAIITGMEFGLYWLNPWLAMMPPIFILGVVVGHVLSW